MYKILPPNKAEEMNVAPPRLEEFKEEPPRGKTLEGGFEPAAGVQSTEKGGFIPSFVKETPEKRAEAILEEAKKEALALKEKAREEGHEEGYSRGREEGLKAEEGRLLPVAEAMTKTLKELSGLREKVLKESEGEAFELALLIARKVLRRELELRPDSVLGVVRAALSRASGWGQVKVRLNPEDLSFIGEKRAELLAELEGVEGLSLVEDESISRGGCYLETNYGEVDARLERQVEEIERALRELRGSFEEGDVP